MEQQLQQALAETIRRAMSGVDASINFLSAEIPDVIHQLLLWKMVEAGVSLSVLLLIFLLSLRGSIQGLLAFDAGDKRGDVSLAFVSFGVCFVASIVLAVHGLEWLGTIVQITIAPKIYLIEYAASLVK